VFDSVAPATPHALDALDAAVSGHLEVAPLVARADLPSATVERNGEAGAGQAHGVCLRPTESGRACPSFYYDDLWWAYTDAMVANVAIDGTWYLAVVSSQPVKHHYRRRGWAGRAADRAGVRRHLALRPRPARPGAARDHAAPGQLRRGPARPEGVDSG
jgi:hypothetical protein